MNYAYEEHGYIKICGTMEKKSFNLYHFKCPYCTTTLLIGTDGGRYGNVGDFTCQTCLRQFHATDDDCNPKSPLHVFDDNKKIMDLSWINQC